MKKFAGVFVPLKIFKIDLARMQSCGIVSPQPRRLEHIIHTAMQFTPYTKTARKRAKALLAEYKSGAIQIWKSAKGFEVVTFEKPGFTYASVPLASADLAFEHIICRAPNTGADLKHFSNIAKRYAAKYGVSYR